MSLECEIQREITVSYTHLPDYEDSEFILAFYSEFKNKLEELSDKKFYGYKVNYFTKTYFDILFNLFTSSEKHINYHELFDMLTKINRYDSIWVKEKIDIIMESECDEVENVVRACNELQNYINIDKYGENLRLTIQNRLKNLKRSISKDRINNSHNIDIYKKIRNEFFNDYSQSKKHTSIINDYIKNNSQIDTYIIKELQYENEDNLLFECKNIREVRYKVPYAFLVSLRRLVDSLNGNDHNEEYTRFGNVRELELFIDRCTENDEISKEELINIRKVIKNLSKEEIAFRMPIVYHNDIQYLYKMSKDFEERLYVSKDSNKIEIISLSLIHISMCIRDRWYRVLDRRKKLY